MHRAEGVLTNRRGADAYWNTTEALTRARKRVLVMKSIFGHCAAFVMLLSTLAIAETVYVDYNDAIDFSKFKTYAWGQGANPNAIQDSIMLQSAQSEINSQLGIKGLQMVQESQNPHLVEVVSAA